MSRGEKDAFGGKLVELDRMTVKAADAAGRGRWCCSTPRSCTSRGSSSAATRRSRASGCRGSSSGSWPATDRRPFAHGSGRLDLARAITAPDNPLTSRVIVNRVWMHHFGEPLVSTPSDFGTRSTPPTHPELLDYLAARLQEEGWSLKALHRLIVLSSTYQQSSFDRPDCRKVDPENRLLWRFTARRLDLEAMRDTLLFVSGRLDAGWAAGRWTSPATPQDRRRTVYGLVDRQSLPAVFRAFDFASPDQSAERRPRTTVPQQALFSMNAPFVIEQAKALAARPDVAGAADRRPGSPRSTGASCARPPAPAEVRGRRAIPRPRARPRRGAAGALAARPAWEQLAQVLLMTNEFLFVD